MAGTEPRCRITNEEHSPLRDVPMQMYDTATGEILATGTSDVDGITSFGFFANGGEREFWFRAGENRNSFGNHGGMVHITQLQDPTPEAMSPPVAPGAKDKTGVANVNIIFTTAVQQVDASVESGTITVQRVDDDGNALTVGVQQVTLSSSSPTGTFSPASLTISDGASTADFTYTDTVSGDPVIEASIA